MKRYVANAIKRYYSIAFLLAIVGAIVYVIGSNALLQKYINVTFTICLILLTVVILISALTIVLLVQTLITLGTGFGWKEKEIKVSNVHRYVIAEDVKIPQTEKCRVRMWRGVGLKPFIGGVLDEYN